MKHNLAFLFLFALVFGCTEDSPEPVIVDYRSVTIQWTGDYAWDGCGFICKVGDDFYKPSNEEFFGEEFKILTDTTVEMKFKDLKKQIATICVPHNVDGIEVLDIR